MTNSDLVFDAAQSTLLNFSVCVLYSAQSLFTFFMAEVVYSE